MSLPKLERLCQDAQKSELEPGNTSNSFFYCLVVIQPVVVYLITLAVGHLLSLNDANLGTLQNIALINFGGHWIGYIISELINSDMFFDITEDITYFCCMIWLYNNIDHPLSASMPSDIAPSSFPYWIMYKLNPTDIIFACALIWCVRLGLFLGYRVLVRLHDWRFEKLMTNRAYNLFGWTSGGTWCFLNGFCLWFLSMYPRNLGGNDVSRDVEITGLFIVGLGVGIFVIGFCIEILADLQKYQFNMLYKSGRNPDFIRSGLWSVSRHPNYLGENTLWFGLAVACIGTLYINCPTDVFPAVSVLCLITPIFSCFFLFFTSLMLLEKRAEKKWGNTKQYKDYKRDVPILFPFHI